MRQNSLGLTETDVIKLPRYSLNHFYSYKGIQGISLREAVERHLHGVENPTPFMLNFSTEQETSRPQIHGPRGILYMDEYKLKEHLESRTTKKIQTVYVFRVPEEIITR